MSMSNDTNNSIKEVGIRNGSILTAMETVGNVCTRIQLSTCVTCKTEFSGEDLLFAHINECHKDEKNFDPTSCQEEPRYSCEFCGKKYRLKVSLASHRNFKHMGYKPPQRGNDDHRRKRRFNQKLDEKETVKTVEIQTPKVLKPCICTVCNISLVSQVEYQKHLNSVHADTRRFPCRHCGKRFATNLQRRVHETIHDPNRFRGEPKFACSQCDNKYHLERSLQSHVRFAHTERKRPSTVGKSKSIFHHHSIGVRKPKPEVKHERSYPCPECDLVFDQRCKVENHMRYHSKDTPFKCEICHQPFVSRQ